LLLIIFSFSLRLPFALLIFKLDERPSRSFPLLSPHLKSFALPSNPTQKPLNMSEMRRAVIKNADMSDEMQQDAVDVATAALVRRALNSRLAPITFRLSITPFYRTIVS